MARGCGRACAPRRTLRLRTCRPGARVPPAEVAPARAQESPFEMGIREIEIDKSIQSLMSTSNLYKTRSKGTGAGFLPGPRGPRGWSPKVQPEAAQRVLLCSGARLRAAAGRVARGAGQGAVPWAWAWSTLAASRGGRRAEGPPRDRRTDGRRRRDAGRGRLAGSSRAQGGGRPGRVPRGVGCPRPARPPRPRRRSAFVFSCPVPTPVFHEHRVRSPSLSRRDSPKGRDAGALSSVVTA